LQSGVQVWDLQLKSTRQWRC